MTAIVMAQKAAVVSARDTLLRWSAYHDKDFYVGSNSEAGFFFLESTARESVWLSVDILSDTTASNFEAISFDGPKVLTIAKYRNIIPGAGGFSASGSFSHNHANTYRIWDANTDWPGPGTWLATGNASTNYELYVSVNSGSLDLSSGVDSWQSMEGAVNPRFRYGIELDGASAGASSRTIDLSLNFKIRRAGKPEAMTFDLDLRAFAET